MASSSNDEPPRSLRAVFEDAEEKRRALEASPDAATSPRYADAVDAAAAQYARALDLSSALAVFSPNESLEDLATASLPYLLASFYLAEVLQRTPTFVHPVPSASGSGSSGAPSSSPSESTRRRLEVLRRARAAYERFVDLADAYGLVSGPYVEMLERYRDDAEGFAVVPPGRDAAARREGKIAGFRAEKALRERLAYLRARKSRRRHNDDEDTGGVDDEDDDGDVDEEVARELHLATVAHAVHQTFQALDSMNREVPLLAQAQSAPDNYNNYNNNGAERQSGNQRPRANDDDDATTWRLDQPLHRSGPGATRPGRGGPLLSQRGTPLQPFTLVGSRADLARGVFRPGHNLPTMSIDEYLEEERRRGGILEGGTDPARPQVDEDDVDAADRETYKAREWDDFKDENPRGSGNTLNMG
ncbi:Type 2A phosphatase-associated protein 42 [Purpureocillium takamizusanense]|uniref:Type 2A phosphatase-associated protein 42 n=1 Tax=Purpureocillium takamizusanense TaxID=2060973 RepID=A0A9Q8QL89_9HYPO|nr:Type 2A phosphatase-associated protein 42 [Purpureocillium takamizusanense]UNI21803.1 Type 2A phosphatase-associated protein 42 [Purpureocillium takamizusanense]